MSKHVKTKWIIAEVLQIYCWHYLLNTIFWELRFKFASFEAFAKERAVNFINGGSGFHNFHNGSHGVSCQSGEKVTIC